MAEQLGVATLLIGVNTQGALAALQTFKKDAEALLSSVNTKAFSGLDKGAEAAGKSAGEKLAKGIKDATTGLKFTNIAEALSFGDALNGTIADLKTYKEALIALRETTKTTTPGFNELNAQIEATSGAVKGLTSSTDNLNDLLSRNATAQFADDMKAWAKILRDNDTALRDTDRAIRDVTRSLGSYDKASRDAISASEAQAKAARDLREAYLGVAGAALKAATGAVGTAANVGKGAINTAGKVVRGAVKAGKAGYQVGSEFGIFDEPSTGPVKKAIQEVLDRFAYLGKQAETTRGVLLRAFEGIGTAGGLTYLIQNADLLKSSLQNLSTVSTFTKESLNGFARFGNYISETWNSAGWLTDNGDTLIGQILKLGSTSESAAAGASNLSDTFIQLSTQGLTSALDALTSLSDALSSVPPEAQAVGLAVTAALGVLSGPLEKQIASGLNGIINNLENVRNKALSVRADLQNFYDGLTRPPQLALPSTEQLQPQQRGLKRLDPQTNSLISATNEAIRLRKAEEAARAEAQLLSDALDTNKNIGNLLPNAVERGARWWQKQAEYAQQVAEYSKKATDNQLKPQLRGEFSRIPVATPNAYPQPAGPKEDPFKLQQSQMLEDLARVRAKREAGPGRRYEVQQEQLSADLARVKERRITEEKLINDVLKGVRKGVEDEAQAQKKLVNEEKKRLSDQKADRTRRVKDAVGSGLIGGAFPALFGQGLGASVGGGVGGAAGGVLGGQFGFGLSLVGTQVGTAFDTAIQKTKDLAKALADPIKNFSTLQESAALSSRAIEQQAESLIEVGRTAEAAALIQSDLIKTYGSFDEAKKLTNATDDLSRSWTVLSVTLASKVAPVLTSLTERFARFAGLNPVGQKTDNRSSLKQFSDYLNELEKTKGYGAKLDVSAQRFKTGVTLKDAGGDPARAEEMAYKKAIDYGRQKYGLTKQEQQQQKAITAAEADKVAAIERANQLRSLSYKLIDAEAQGNKRAALDAQLTTVNLQRQNDLKALGQITPANSSKAKSIDEEAARKTYALRRQINDLNKDEYLTRLRVTQRVASIEEQITNERRRGDLSGSGNAALQAVQTLRDARRAKQEADAAYQLRPNDTNLEASRTAANALALAAAKTRTDLVEAFRSAKREAQDASSALKDAYLNLLQLRTGNNGLNNYLSGETLQQREKNTYSNLRPIFDEALNRARNQLNSEGISNFNYNPLGNSVANTNQNMINFINAQRADEKAQQGLQRTQEDSIKANNSLIVATDALTTNNLKLNDTLVQAIPALQALAQKDWTVTLNAPGWAASGDVINAVNSRS